MKGCSGTRSYQGIRDEWRGTPCGGGDVITLRYEPITQELHLRGAPGEVDTLQYDQAGPLRMEHRFGSLQFVPCLVSVTRHVSLLSSLTLFFQRLDVRDVVAAWWSA